MTTNETHGTFEDILGNAQPEIRRVCESLRHLIASLHEDFVEVVWPKHRIASYGVGPKKMTEHYAYIGVQGSHVNLGFYHGASLADPEGLLEGTGKELRHVKLRDVAAAQSGAVTALLREAIRERKRAASKA
ncbi:MAG: DUF1801 domain-containing protein [Thermoanaerobaculia bacterium]